MRYIITNRHFYKEKKDNQWVVGPYASNGEDYVDLVLSMVNLNNNEN